SCTGHSLETGAQLWRHPWRGDQPKVAQPVLLGGDRIAIFAGYGQGGDAFRGVASEGTWKTEALWSSAKLMAEVSNVVLHGGHLYGLSDGVLTCVNADSGERVWRGGRYGHGQFLRAGDLLVISAESGAEALVEASPSGFRELSSRPTIEGKTWNVPA